MGYIVCMKAIRYTHIYFDVIWHYASLRTNGKVFMYASCPNLRGHM